MSEERKPIAHVVATVRIPIYEGDEVQDRQVGNWFEFNQPGITDGGEIGVCKRPVELIDQRYVEVQS